MKTWLVAVAITLCQLITALSLSKSLNLPASYRRLCQWDSEWYGDIVERGYARYFPIPPSGHAKDNGGFFPGYPISARGLHLLLGMDSQLALLTVAQASAVVFWAALLFLLKRWRMKPPHQALLVLAVLSHPCSFYLVAGYSESFFCAALAIFIYLSQRRSEFAWVGVSSSGFVLTATRLVGLPITILPALGWLFRNRPQFRKAILIAGVSAFGALFFILYCKVHFGDFDHYMKTQKEGWGVVPNYSAVFRTENYHWNSNGDEMAMSLSAIAFWLTLCVEVAIWARSRDLNRSCLWRIRMPWYLGALMLWYISCSGVASVSFRSLIRYSFSWSILLIIAWAHLFSFSIRLPTKVKAVAFAILSGLLTLVIANGTLELLNTYLHGGWVS